MLWFAVQYSYKARHQLAFLFTGNRKVEETNNKFWKRHNSDEIIVSTHLFDLVAF